MIADVLGHGNSNSILPGQIEAAFRKRSDAAGGLLFSDSELAEFNAIATEIGRPQWNISSLPTA